MLKSHPIKGTPDSSASLQTLVDLYETLDLMRSEAKCLMERYDADDYNGDDITDVDDDKRYVLGDPIDAGYVDAIRLNLTSVQALLEELEQAVDDDRTGERKITWNGEEFIDIADP